MSNSQVGKSTLHSEQLKNTKFSFQVLLLSMFWWILGPRLQQRSAVFEEKLWEPRRVQVIYEIFFPFSFRLISHPNPILTFDRHVGDSNVKCMCPYGYSGNKCETHEFLDAENGEKSALNIFPTHASSIFIYSQNVIYQKTLREPMTSRSRSNVPVNVWMSSTTLNCVDVIATMR